MKTYGLILKENQLITVEGQNKKDVEKNALKNGCLDPNGGMIYFVNANSIEEAQNIFQDEIRKKLGNYVHFEIL